MPTDRRITVPQVAQAMGGGFSNHDMWSVGLQLQAMHQTETGLEPPKGLRPKSNGAGGTHCFALYPPTWELRIRALLEDRRRVGASQLTLDI